MVKTYGMHQLVLFNNKVYRIEDIKKAYGRVYLEIKSIDSLNFVDSQQVTPVTSSLEKMKSLGFDYTESVSSENIKTTIFTIQEQPKSVYRGKIRKIIEVTLSEDNITILSKMVEIKDRGSSIEYSPYTPYIPNNDVSEALGFFVQCEVLKRRPWRRL